MNIIEKIKDFCFRWEVRKWHQEIQEERNPGFIAYHDVKQVLLLFESEWSEQNQHVVAMGKRLEADGKKVTYCMYVNKKQAITSTLPQRLVIDMEHKSRLDKPEALTMRQLEENHYDVLIDLSTFECRPLRYALLHANASMKCGLKGPKSKFYDLTIDLSNRPELPEDAPEPTPEEKASELFQHIHHYLKTFK
mgnify:CR=1 FL=1